LLDRLQAIEKQHGRVRVRRWGARTLDLDILLYGRRRINNRRLIVPHAAMPDRNFVLLPLAEITPDLDIPGLGSVAALLRCRGTADIERIR